MSRPAAAARRTLIAAFASPGLASRQIAATQRQISFAPWRKSTTVVAVGPKGYFPRRRFLPTRQTVQRKLLYWTFSGVLIYLCVNVYLAFVIDPMLDYLEEEMLEDPGGLPQDDDDDEDEEDYELAGYFLPFPFGIQEQKEPPYKGSDPEWARFVQINKDKKKQDAIRGELAALYLKWVNTQKQLSKALSGKIRVSKYWIDIVYPVRPPPSYHIPGICWDFEEGLSWTTVPLDPNVAGAIQTALYPRAVALATWTFLRSLFSSTAQDMADALRPKGSPPSDITWQSAILVKMNNKDEGTVTDPATKAQIGPLRTITPDMAARGSEENINIDGLAADFGMSPRTRSAVSNAGAVLNQNWKPSPKRPSRGCLHVSGLVDILGDKAIMSVYLVGWYNPESSKFEGVQAVIRHIRPLTQRPLRA